MESFIVCFVFAFALSFSLFFSLFFSFFFFEGRGLKEELFLFFASWSAHGFPHFFFSVNLNLPGVNLCIDPGLAPPTELQMLQLRKIVTTGLADHVAR